VLRLSAEPRGEQGEAANVAPAGLVLGAGDSHPGKAKFGSQPGSRSLKEGLRAGAEASHADGER